MTDKKISELPEITTPATADILPILDIDANLTKKITTANLTTYINSNFDTEIIRDTVGAMLTGNTETDITVTHDDANDKINFVVSVSASNLPSSLDAAKIANGNVSNAEFETLDGVTSGIQSQIDTKLAKGGDTMTGVLAMGNNAITTSSTVDGRDLGTDGAKLDGIESGATADQTASEIRTLVESATDSNVFTDADHTKLNAIEASATADQTDAEIRAAVEAASDSNVFTDADHSKLDGIEASADVTDATNVTAAGALMDSELADVAAVKGINQALTTTSSPTFAGITGPLTGNASTASSLAPARTINLGGEVTGSASFDGSHDMTITGTIAANSIGINELALNDGSNGQFIQTNGAGTISFASAIGSSVINNSAANRVTTVNANTTDFDAESNLTFDGSTLDVTGDITVSGTVDGADVAAMSTKLSGIEASATADQTDAEIRAAVEAATDSNVFTDADHTKLNGIETSATADQTASEIRTLVGSATDSNVFTDALLTKLNGIETAADVTDATNVDAAGAIMNSDLGTKGQIVVGDGSGDPTILSVGTDGHYLKADSSAASGVAWASVPAGVGGSNGVDFDDNVKARFGTGNDLEIFHDGSNSFISDTGTGILVIKSDASIQFQNAAGEAYFDAQSNGAVSLYYDDAVQVFTTSNGLQFDDNKKALFGDSGDFEIYHNGSQTIMDDTGTGSLEVRTNQFSLGTAGGTASMLSATQGGAVELYHNNNKMFSTTTNGCQVEADRRFEIVNGSSWSGEVVGKIEHHSNSMYHQYNTSFITRNSSGTNTLTIDSSGNGTFTGNVTAFSDNRLKEDVKTIDNALDKVSKLRGVEYTRKDTQAREIGVIAQEVKEVVPELVIIENLKSDINPDGIEDMHTMKYGNTVSLLIEAIKELKAEVEELKKGK